MPKNGILSSQYFSFYRQNTGKYRYYSYNFVFRPLKGICEPDKILLTKYFIPDKFSALQKQLSRGDLQNKHFKKV